MHIFVSFLCFTEKHYSTHGMTTSTHIVNENRPREHFQQWHQEQTVLVGANTVICTFFHKILLFLLPFKKLFKHTLNVHIHLHSE
jgi:hypothetical protein